MVAIVSGNSLGLSLTSLATLGQSGINGAATQGRNGEAVYVNAANGNLVLQDRDDYVAARGLSVAAVRTYNSQGLLSDDNGDNWSTGVSAQQLRLTGILNTEGSTLTRTERDGAQADYAYDTTTGSYVTSEGSGAFDSIVYDGATSQYVWSDGGSGLTERYESGATGRLLSSTDTSGNSLNYTYVGNLLVEVANSSDESLYFDYIGNNLSQVRAVTRVGVTTTRTRYTYDERNRLHQLTVDLTPEDNNITDGNTYVTTYTYEGDSRRLASVSQIDGTSLTFGYIQINGSWKVHTVTDALGRTTTFDYSGNGETVITDALGGSTTFTSDVQGRLTQIAGPVVGSASQVTRFAYNAQGDLTQTIDGRQNSVDMIYDDRGNQTLQRDAAGNTVTRSFNARNQLVTETVYLLPDPDGAGVGQPARPQTTRYVYDATDRNLLRFVLSPEGRVTEHVYNDYGQRTSTYQHAGAVYSVAALAVTACPTEAEMATWVGSLDLSHSQRVYMIYDFRGQLSRTMAFSAFTAWGAGVMNGEQAFTRYVYDQAGRLLSTISPRNGSTTVFTYDGLGRVLTKQDALNHVTINTYDDAQNKTEVELANGLTTVSTFDRAGRLISIQQSSPTVANLGETRYFYDAADRLVMTQDPTGVRQWMLYDAAGRKVADVDGNGSLTEYSYNANGQLTRTLAYAVPVNVAALVNGAGNPLNPTLQSIRPADDWQTPFNIHTWHAYDAANRLVKTVNDRLGVEEFTYDGASRIIKVRRYTAPLSSAQAAALGESPAASAITPTGYGNDPIKRNYYSADGLLVASLDEENYLSQHSYDAAGQLIATTRYANRMVGLVNDDITPPTVIAPGANQPATAFVTAQPAAIPSLTGSDQVTRYYYNGKGQQVGQVDAEGYFTRKTYDASGNLVSTLRYITSVGAEVTANTRFQDIPRPVSVDDQITSSVYDALNRISRSTNVEETVTEYKYDSVGNLVSVTAARGLTDERSALTRHDIQGRVVGELSGEGAQLLVGVNLSATQINDIWRDYGLTHTYDAAGRRSSTTDQNGYRTFFYYNVDGQLTHTVNALGEVQESQFNSLGQLKTTTQFGTRISVIGLTGGLATTAFLNTLALVRNSTRDSVTQHFYDGAGNLSGVVDPNGNQVSFATTLFGELVAKITYSNTHMVSEHYQRDRRGLITRFTHNAFVPAGPTTDYVYDAFGRVVRTVDAKGQAEDQRYDRLGRVVQTIDRSGVGRSSTYDAFDRVLTRTNALNQTTRYRYDDDWRSLTTTTPEGIEFLVLHNRHGQTVGVTSGRGVAQPWVAAFPLADDTLPLADYTTYYEYDRDGNLLETRNGDIVTSQSFDAAKRLRITTDANNNEVHYDYDAANRVLSVTTDPDGVNLTTNYRYDAKGQAAWTQDPNGVWTQTEYSRGGEVVAVTVDPNRGPDWVEGQADDNPAGLALVTVYTYDEMGNQLTVAPPGGPVTRYSYDAFNRRIKEQHDPDGLNLVTDYSYDRLGNLNASTNGLSSTIYVYDANNRVRGTVDAMGNVQLSDYNAEGLLTKTTNLSAPVDLEELLATASDPDSDAISWEDLNNYLTADAFDAEHDRVETRIYDLDNRLRYTVDGEGGVIELEYDADGNVQIETHFAGHFAAEAVGAPGWNPYDPEHDVRVWREYDQMNRVTSTRTAAGQRTETRYDGNGNVLEHIEYATPDLGEPLPNEGKDVTRDRHMRYTYDAANRLVYTVDGVGAFTKNEYDDGNLVRQITYARRAEGKPHPVVGTNGEVSYEGGGVVGIDEGELDWQGWLQDGGFASAADRITHMVYDSVGRLTHTVDPARTVSERTYDERGNVLRQTTFAQPLDETVVVDNQLGQFIHRDATRDRTSHAVYDAVGLLTYSVDAEGAVTRFGYDSNGNAVETTAYGRTISVGSNDIATRAMVEAALHAPPSGEETPANRRTLRLFDGANRLAYTINALGYVQHNTYDGIGRLKSTTQFAQAIALAPQAQAWDIGAFQLATAEEAASWPSEMLQMLQDSANGIGPTADQARAMGYPMPRGHWAWFNDLTTIETLVGEYNPTVDRQTLYEYDAAGNLLESRDALGQREAYTYDALGNKKTFQNKNGAIWLYDYDAASRLVVETSPPVAVAASVAAGAPTLLQTTRSVVTRTEYDALGNVAARTEAASTATSNDGFTTHYHYDAAGRQVRVRFPAVSVYSPQTDPLATRAVYEVIGEGEGGVIAYPARGRYETQPIELSTETIYNTFGESVASKDVADNWSYKVYDNAGRVHYGVDAEGYVTRHGRNAFGDVESLTRYAESIDLPQIGRTELLAQDINQALNELDHTDDRILVTAYDQLGRAIQIDEGFGFVYDNRAESTLLAAWEPKRSGIQYNAFGEKVLESTFLNPYLQEAASTRHYFDVAGHEVATIDAMGYLTERQFDAAGDVMHITEFAQRVSSASLSSYVRGDDAPEDRVVSIEYDLLGRKMSETQHGVHFVGAPAAGGDVTTSYGYDAVGNLVRTTDDAGQSTYTYHDVLGRITAVVAPQRAISTPSGTRQASPLTEFFRDARGNIVMRVDHALGTAAADEDGYAATPIDYVNDHISGTSYDSLGHALAVTDASGAVTQFSYDKAGQVAKQWQVLTTAEGEPRTTYKVFAYDKLGQQIRVTEPGAEGTLVTGVTGTFTSARDKGRRQNVPVWHGNNVVTLGWAGLIDPEAGRVRVTINYTTKGTLQSNGTPQPNTRVPRSLTNEWDAIDVAGGVDLTWADPQVANTNGGIESLGTVTVYQFNAATGQWDIKFSGTTAPSRIDRFDGANATIAIANVPADDALEPQVLSWATPPAGHRQELRIRAVGEITWEQATHLIHEIRADVSGIDMAELALQNGPAPYDTPRAHYEYDLRFVPENDNFPVQLATGSFNYVGEAPPYQGPSGVPTYPGYWGISYSQVDPVPRLVWSTPPSFTTAVVRVRAWGSSGGWVTLFNELSPDDGGEMSLSLEGLGMGSYEVELLIDGYPWEGAYDGSAQAHFTGMLNVAGSETGLSDTTEPFVPGHYLPAGPGSAAVTDTTLNTLLRTPGAIELHYNAFGEIESRGRIGSDGVYRADETMAFDTLGRLWKTNQGDGIDKIFLHDLQGRVTAQLTSATSKDDAATTGGVAIANLWSAYEANYTDGLIRTEMRYDLLGRLIETKAPYVSTVGMAAVQDQMSRDFITVGTPATTTNTQLYFTNPNFFENRLAVQWADLRQLGDGDVRVTLNFDLRDQHLTRSFLLNASEGGTGANLLWYGGFLELPTLTPRGIDRITSLTVEKQALNGQWLTMHAVHGPGTTTTERVLIPRSNDTVDVSNFPPAGLGEVRLELQNPGETTWWTVAPGFFADFGNALVLNVDSFPPGIHNYRVSYASAGDSAPTVKSTGQISIGTLNAPAMTTLPQLTGTLLQWATPPAGITQTLRVYDSAGWSDYTVNIVSTGGQSVFNLGNLGYSQEYEPYEAPSEIYHYELIFTATGSVTPLSHASGRITLTGEPQVYVPPSGMHTLSIGMAAVNADRALAWEKPPVDTLVTFRYRLLGSSDWIVGLEAVSDGDGGSMQFSFTGLPNGQYQTELLFSNYTEYLWEDGSDQGHRTGLVNLLGPQSLTYQDTTPPFIEEHYLPRPPDTYALQDTTLANGSALLPTTVRPETGRAQVRREYDRWGNLTSVTDPRNVYWVTRYTYDWASRQLSETKPIDDGFGAGATVTTESRYNALGQLVESQDALGTVTHRHYDQGGNLLSQIMVGANGVTTQGDSNSYNAFGDRVTTLDGNEVLTHYSYDKMGRVLNSRTQAEVNSARPATETYTYDELGHRTVVTTGNGENTVYDFDLRGNISRIRKGVALEGSMYAYLQATQGVTLEILVQESLYDANNHKIAELDGTGFAKSWTNDYFGHVLAHTDLGGAAYHYKYDGNFRLTRQTNTRGQDLNYTFNAAGQLELIKDDGLHQNSYFDYDLAGNRLSEVVWQANQDTPTLGYDYQMNRMAYDAAGRLRLVTGLNGARVEYSYDASGNRIHQWGRYNQGIDANGVVQENAFDYWSAYDEQGRQIIAEGQLTQDAPRPWNPANPNLPPVVQTAYGNITLNNSQGHYIQYDDKGNRTLDLSWGKRVTTYQPTAIECFSSGEFGLVSMGQFALDDVVPQPDGRAYIISTGQSADGYRNLYNNGSPDRFHGADGYAPESYVYDDHDRIQSVWRDGMEIERREYDDAGHLTRSGPLDGTPASDLAYWTALGAPDRGKVTNTHYDNLGRAERVESQSLSVVDLDPLAIEAAAPGSEQTYYYDKAGNVTGMHLYNRANGDRQGYTYALKRLEGYVQGVTYGQGGGGNGTTTNTYDVNGRLVGVSDSGQPASNRSFVNDSQGTILQVNQGGQITRQLVVSGTVLGRYLKGLDQADPYDDNGNPRFTDITEFDSNFRSISGSFPSASPGNYQVQAGDSLQSIAQAAYGDNRLWWKIAEANGLSGNNDVRAGQTLTIPSATSSSNAADTYHPYDPSAVIGDTTPYVPAPVADNGCGVLGQIVVAIVVVVVAYYAGIEASAYVGEVLGAAAGAAAGSAAGQLTAMALGMQEEFNWNAVAIAAVGGAVGAGLNVTTGLSHVADAAARAAISNAVSQRFAVVIGEQKEFHWKNVAAAAVGGAAGQLAGDALTGTNGATDSLSKALKSVFGDATKIAADTLQGYVTGVVTAAASGGQVDNTSIAADAFGNALGNAFNAASDPKYKQRQEEREAARKRAVTLDFPSIGNALGASLAAGSSSGGSGAQQQPPGAVFNWDDADMDAGPHAAAAARLQAQAATSAGGGSGWPAPGESKFADAALGRRIQWSFEGAEPAPDAGPRTVTAGRGDSYAKIAREVYGDERYALALAAANGAKTTTLALGASVVLPDLSNANLKQGGAFIAADAAERAQANAANQATQAQAATVGNGACTPSNPYGLSQDQMQAVAKDLFGRLPVRGLDVSSEPSALQRLAGSFEVTANGLYNGLVVNAVAGTAGWASAVIPGVSSGDVVRSVQAGMNLPLLSDGGKYMGNWMQGTSLVQGLEHLKTNTGDYYSQYGPMAGALGYTAPDALLMLAPAAPKAFGSVGRAGVSYGFNALPEAAATSLLRASAAVDRTLYSLNPLNYEWGLGSGAIARSGFGPLGLKMSGAVEVRVPSWASPAQAAQYAEYTAVANQALDAGYLSASGRVSTKGALRIEADRAISAELAAARAEGRSYQGVVGHGPDTTWTGKGDAFRWIDQDFRVNSSLGGQTGRYPLGYKPTKFILVGGG